MANILDYLDWRGDLTFDQSPFNEVDNYILCSLSCPDYSGIVPAEGITLEKAAEAYFAGGSSETDRLGVLVAPLTLKLLKQAAGTRRFSQMILQDYHNRVDQEKNEQFAGLTYQLPDGLRYVAFRGTDDTIVAWKEDFLLGVEDVIQAQVDAGMYLLVQAAKAPGPLMVGGHSKGGNLAVWSALKAPAAVQERLVSVWNNDGPGFRRDQSGTEAYQAIKPKLTTIVSQHTTVGKLLCYESDCQIVRSNKMGMAAHDGFNWEVLGTSFVRCDDYAIASRAFDAAFQQVEQQMDLERRREFINALFDLLSSTGAVTLTDLTETSLRTALELGNEMRKNQDVRWFLQTLLSAMLRQTMTNVKTKSAGKLPIPKLPAALKAAERKLERLREEKETPT